MQEQSKEFVPPSPDHATARKNFIEKQVERIMKEKGCDEEEAREEAETMWDEGKKGVVNKEFIQDSQTGSLLTKEEAKKIRRG